MPVGVKHRSSLSYIAKPKLSGMRALYASSNNSSSDRNRKFKSRKLSGSNRYDQMKRGTLPDYTDYAYKEAVSRLRSMLNDCYVPPSSRYASHFVSHRGDDSDEESGVSVTVSDTTRIAQLGSFKKFSKSSSVPKLSQSIQELSNIPNNSTPPELLGFIERQEEYIEQLEKESQYCRDELSQLVSKVKDLIAENEALHEQHKSGSLKSSATGLNDPSKDKSSYDFSEVRSKPHLEGPTIVFESRISELEAQLTQARLDAKKAQEEANTYKKKLLDNDPTSTSSDFYRQIETLHREKKELSDSLNRLQASIAQMRERESDASRKALRTQDVAEKAQIDRQQAELEVQRLKSELEMQHERLLDVLSDQTRKVGDERTQAERRYLQHVEQLSTELALQRDSATKLQLELERHQRIEEDLRRDLSAKNSTIENVRKELSSKIAILQSDLAVALSERDALEQDLSSNRMTGERSERVSKQEASRWQLEVTALRQRIERTDAELMQSRRDNLRLSEQIASQEKEITLYKIKIGEMELGDGKDGKSKKGDSVLELEGLVEKQSQAMTLLTQQCHSLALRLEDSAVRHKHEMAELQSNLEMLTNRLESSISSRPWPEEHPTDQPQYDPVSTAANYGLPTEGGNLYKDESYHPEVSQPDISSYLPQPQTARKVEDVQPATVNEKPPLSRSSSRGDRSESPSVRKDSRKSPLQRRESRLQLQQRTPPPAPDYGVQAANSYLENQYSTDPVSIPSEPQFPEDTGRLQSSERDHSQYAEYEQPYQSRQPQDEYASNAYEQPGKASPSQYQYEQPSTQYATEPYEYQDQYGENPQRADYAPPENYYQSQEPFRPESDVIRNRPSSRESLRNSYQGSPQGYQTTDSIRQKITSSNESLGPQPQRYTSQQDNIDPQYYKGSSPDQGRRTEHPSSYETDEGQFQATTNPRQPTANAYDPPLSEQKSDPPRQRQGSASRREPSTTPPRQQKPPTKMSPSKFQ